MKPPAVDRDLTLSPEFHRKDITRCACCGKGVAHTGLPFFYRVTIERFGLDANACRRRNAMEEFFMPAPGLAEVFSTGEPLGKRFDLTARLLICETCSMNQTCVAALNERGPEDEDDDEVDNPLAAAAEPKAVPS